MIPEKLFFTLVSLRPGLHVVVTIPEHASDVAPKRILRLLIHRLQYFLPRNMNAVACDHNNYVKTKDKGIREKLKKRVCNGVLAILTIYMETRL